MSKKLTKIEFLEKYPDIITDEQLKKLQIDYFTEHYPKNKRLPEIDIKYLFLDLNLTAYEMADCFGCPENRVRQAIRFYKLRKTSEQRKEILARTCMRKYGVKHPHQLPEIREKVCKTNLEKYGTYCSSKANKVKEKQAQTCLERYGAKSALQNKQIKEKSKQTCIEKYGVDNVSKSKEVINKIKAKVPETLKKMENTCLKRYGAKSFWKSKYMDWDQASNKKEKTTLERYGTTNVMKLDYFVQKGENTKKINKSFTKSKPEDIIYKNLLNKFKVVQRQYKEIRYPFNCDFYIPKIDLFIEYQGYQGHGGECFDPNNEKHLEKIKIWEQKSNELNSKGKKKKQYSNYIKIWTIQDVIKRNTAKQNNLNWIEFFNIKQFHEWFDKL